jgi:micrococcal nuclease
MLKTIIAALLLFFAPPALFGAPDTSAKVIQVIDFATLRVEFQGREEVIRLIGIDAPEYSTGEEDCVSGDDDDWIDPAEQQAAEFVRTLVYPGKTVTLEFDVEPRDEDNRLLAYISLPDATMLNYTIILKGYARPVTDPPNVKYAGQFSWAYQVARNNKSGLWKQ